MSALPATAVVRQRPPAQARWSKAATPRDPPLVHNAPMPYACGLLGPLPAAGPARIQTGPANTPEPIAGSVIG